MSKNGDGFKNTFCCKHTLVVNGERYSTVQVENIVFLVGLVYFSRKLGNIIGDLVRAPRLIRKKSAVASVDIGTTDV